MRGEFTATVGLRAALVSAARLCPVRFVRGKGELRHEVQSIPASSLFFCPFWLLNFVYTEWPTATMNVTICPTPSTNRSL